MWDKSSAIPHWGKTLLNVLPSALWIMRFSILTGGNRYHSWLSLNVNYKSLSSFKRRKGGSFPVSGLFSSPTRTVQYSAEHAGVTCRSLEFSFNATLSSQSLSCKLWPPSSPRFSALSPQVSEPPGRPLPVMCPGDSLKAVNSGGCRAPITCFPTHGNHCPSWLMSSVLKTSTWCIFTKSMMSYDLASEVTPHHVHKILLVRESSPHQWECFGEGGMNFWSQGSLEARYLPQAVSTQMWGVGKLDWMGRLGPDGSTSERVDKNNLSTLYSVNTSACIEISSHCFTII